MKVTRISATIVIVTAMLAAPACIHVGRANAFQKATQLGDYEKQMWNSVKAGKWNDVHAHLAETFQSSTPNGAHNREATLNFLKSMKLDGFEIRDLKTSPNGADMVVTYDLDLRGTIDGQPIPPMRLHVLTVWQSVKRGWIEVAQSMTPDGMWPITGTRMIPQ